MFFQLVEKEIFRKSTIQHFVEKACKDDGKRCLCTRRSLHTRNHLDMITFAHITDQYMPEIIFIHIRAKLQTRRLS